MIKTTISCYCDLCKKEISKSNLFQVLLPIERIEDGYALLKTEKMDLCPQCADKIYKQLKCIKGFVKTVKGVS